MRRTATRERIFAKEYIVDLNGTRAAIAAGYSERGADVAAIRLLGKARVQKLIQDSLDGRTKKLDLSAERILQELCKLAFLDPRKLFNENGALKKITELDDDTAAAIAGFDIEDLYEHFAPAQARKIGIIKKFKFADKGQNLERLGRHLKLFTDKVEVRGVAVLTDEEIMAKLEKLEGKK